MVYVQRYIMDYGQTESSSLVNIVKTQNVPFRTGSKHISFSLRDIIFSVLYPDIIVWYVAFFCDFTDFTDVSVHVIRSIFKGQTKMC